MSASGVGRERSGAHSNTSLVRTVLELLQVLLPVKMMKMVMAMRTSLEEEVVVMLAVAVEEAAMGIVQFVSALLQTNSVKEIPLLHVCTHLMARVPTGQVLPAIKLLTSMPLMMLLNHFFHELSDQGPPSKLLR